MISLIYLIAAVIVCNLAPAFAPLTWTLLVFFALNTQLPVWLIVTAGAMSAGREVHTKICNARFLCNFTIAIGATI